MARLLAGSSETAQSLPISPAAFGILALVAFGVLLAVTYAFRSVSNRH